MERSKIKDKYGYTNDAGYATFFNQFVDKEILSRRWSYDTLDPSLDKVIFTIGSTNFYYKDFENIKKIVFPICVNIVLFGGL